MPNLSQQALIQKCARTSLRSPSGKRRVGGGAERRAHARCEARPYDIADGSRVSAVGGDTVAPASAARIASAVGSATIRLSSGRQEPQLVPARSAAPMPSTLVALPDWSAPRMVASPTPKQAHTIGPALVRPSVERPDSIAR